MPSRKQFLSQAAAESLRGYLLAWYDGGHRDLPWRRTRDPYRIWVSEIMLQQTRVAAVLEHYREFFRRFPDVSALAHAKPAAVLAAWSGLGYYRRARALHEAARLLLSERSGVLPRTAQEWRELPGIGRYTAAAIASIAFGEPVAVVDGNVERVLTRLFAWRELRPARAWEAAEVLLSGERPGDFNQAIMELGATVCLPARPRCAECPWKQHCATARRASLRPATLPVGAAPAKREVRHARYLLAQRRGRVLLRRRAADASLMPGMWELPEAAGLARGEPARFRHSILDTTFLVDVYCRDEIRTNGDRQLRWFVPAELPAVPLTGLCRKVLRAYRLL